MEMAHLVHLLAKQLKRLTYTVHRRDFDVNVNPIQQAVEYTRAGDMFLVFRHLAA